jgi:hypothetical protein
MGLGKAVRKNMDAIKYAVLQKGKKKLRPVKHIIKNSRS